MPNEHLTLSTKTHFTHTVSSSREWLRFHTGIRCQSRAAVCQTNIFSHRGIINDHWRNSYWALIGWKAIMTVLYHWFPANPGLLLRRNKKHLLSSELCSEVSLPDSHWRFIYFSRSTSLFMIQNEVMDRSKWINKSGDISFLSLLDFGPLSSCCNSVSHGFINEHCVVCHQWLNGSY